MSVSELPHLPGASVPPLAAVPPGSPAPPARPVRTGPHVLPGPPRLPRPNAWRRRPRSAYILFGCGAALVPWLVILALTLPEWTVAWVGLDAMESLGLIATGLLTLRRHPLRPVVAGATATLLVIDAWFDVTTSTGVTFVMALLMAVLAELPLAALCGYLASAPARAEIQRRAGPLMSPPDE